MTVRLFRLIKLTVALAAVLLSVLLVRGWPVAGAGLHQVCLVLRASCGDGAAVRGLTALPLWAWIVRKIGWDVWGLGLVSAVAGLVGAWLVYLAVKQLFGWVVKNTKAAGAAGEMWYVLIPTYSGMITAYAYLASVLDGGPSPLAAFLILPALGLFIASAAFARRRAFKLWTLAAIVFALAAVELALNRRALLPMAMGAFGRFLVLGLLPCAAMMNFTYLRKFVIHRLHRRIGLASWAAVVLVAGALALKPSAGDRAAYEMAGLIVRNAEGKAAVAAGGTLSDLLAFMLPEGQRLIELARERDPAYGRELSEWVRQEVKVRGEGEQRNVEDLIFAAELGPSSLFDEWAKLDKPGFEAKVMTDAFYFPTREKWDEAVSVVCEMEEGEPLRGYFTWLVGASGNALGCRFLERGEQKAAWEAFWTVSDRVDKWNYTALLNLAGMAERGFAAPREKLGTVNARRKDVESRLKTWERMRYAALAGGRLYVDPAARAKYDAAQREAAKARGLTPAERDFVEKLDRAQENAESGEEARKAIRDLLAEKRRLPEPVLAHLIAIDVALQDREGLERDVLAILRTDRHNTVANAVMGEIRLGEFDFEGAERYLRRAVAAENAPPAAYWNLALVAGSLAHASGRPLDEAEALARKALAMQPENWKTLETLAAILVRSGKTDEGEKTLARAEEAAAKAKVDTSMMLTFELDRVFIAKARGDDYHLKIELRKLRYVKDPPKALREQIEALER